MSLFKGGKQCMHGCRYNKRDFSEVYPILKVNLFIGFIAVQKFYKNLFLFDKSCKHRFSRYVKK